MNTNELQNDLKPEDEMRELTSEDLVCVGAGSGGVIHTDGTIRLDSVGLIHG